MNEIIIYRNPAEAALWDIFMNSPYTFPVIVAAAVGIVVAALVPVERWVSYRNQSYGQLALGLIAGALTFWWMV